MIAKRKDMPSDDNGSENFRAPLLINASELATILKCSTRTIWRRNSAGLLPPPIRFGSQVLWRYQDILHWIEQDCPPNNPSVNKPR